MKLSEATVLIVDDELELLEIFAAWLERTGCRILTAANGAEALDILLRVQVHALISDIRMPIMDGVTLLRRVHEHNLTIPSIILVSGFGDVERREMHALGVEKLLEKPLRRQHLLAALECSLMDREELWLTPVADPVDHKLLVRLDTMETIDGECGFHLGRGGCCFPSDRKLVEDRIIELELQFSGDGLTLKAQGEVEWYKPDCSCAGLTFHYLDPVCRDWVVQWIKARGLRSHIPQCSAGPKPAVASFQPSHFPEPAPEPVT